MSGDRADRWATPHGIITGDLLVAWTDAWRHYGETGDDSLLEALWNSGYDPDEEIGLSDGETAL